MKHGEIFWATKKFSRKGYSHEAQLYRFDSGKEEEVGNKQLDYKQF